MATSNGTGRSLWAHDNLFAWCVGPFDLKRRGPEERAGMLAKLGFKSFAHRKGPDSVDVEIEALKRQGIELLAWEVTAEADDPITKESFEAFERHNIRPQIWVTQSVAGLIKGQEEWTKMLPNGPTLQRIKAESHALSEAEKAAIHAAMLRLYAEDLPTTPEEHARRVEQEADRIHSFVKLASRYGCRIYLYNHNGWFGMVENQLEIIDRLKELGVTDVGMVYNFSHARDNIHDDSKDFGGLWEKIKAYVGAVNISGLKWQGQYVYPSQGDSELDMMRVIEESDWKGPIGLDAEKGGDAEITLGNYRVGLDWLAAELEIPGSGGPRPFPSA